MASDITLREAIIDRYNTLMARSTLKDDVGRRFHFRINGKNLTRLLPAAKQARILDAGCGSGELLDFLRRNAYENLSGFDLSPEHVSLCRQAGFPFVQQADIQEWFDGSKGPWDVIFMFDILEHLPKDEAFRVLISARKCLSDNGVLFVRIPNSGGLYGNFVFQTDLTHEFTTSEYGLKTLLETAGFSDVQVEPWREGGSFGGDCREAYLRILHRIFWAGTSPTGRPKIWTKNLFGRGHVGRVE